VPKYVLMTACHGKRKDRHFLYSVKLLCCC